VAFLGRIPGTNSYSDLVRHPENEVLPGVLAFRPEASLIYVNADAVVETVLVHPHGVIARQISAAYDLPRNIQQTGATSRLQMRQDDVIGRNTGCETADFCDWV
jgi:MFS superfamily sulfate permease-like transporter